LERLDVCRDWRIIAAKMLKEDVLELLGVYDISLDR
jgi:hypothetical protein